MEVTMEKIYIFGASKLGEVAFKVLKDSHQILGFIDNDTKKHGNTFCEIPVYSPDIITSIDCQIIIGSSFRKEIELQLQNMGFLNFKTFTFGMVEPELYNSHLISNELTLVSANELINSVGPNISIENITFSNGGSTAMDYFFLKAVAIKQQAKVFLEIGAWTGESAATVAEVVDQCYSISLPDDHPSVSYAFDHFCHKENFSRHFSHNKENIINFQENSFEFNYDKIQKNIDLVFIDGDHSYQSICKDTENIFSKCGYEDTIVVWHDFKNLYNELVLTTYQAVKDTLPEQYLGNLFAVQGNYCGVYIPKKHQHLFNYNEDRNKVFSYKVELTQKISDI